MMPTQVVQGRAARKCCVGGLVSPKLPENSKTNTFPSPTFPTALKQKLGNLWCRVFHPRLKVFLISQGVSSLVLQTLESTALSPGPNVKRAPTSSWRIQTPDSLWLLPRCPFLRSVEIPGWSRDGSRHMAMWYGQGQAKTVRLSLSYWR